MPLTSPGSVRIHTRAAWQNRPMLHLALTLQLLAPAPELPDRLALRAPTPTPAGHLWAQRLSAGAGVVAAQAASVGLAVAGDGLYGPGHLALMKPSFEAGLTFVASELLLAPLFAALGARLADPDPGALLEDRLAGAYQVRAVQGAVLAGLEFVAALAGSQTLALVAVLALFGSDYVLYPLALASDPATEPAPPGPPAVDAPPRLGMGLRF